MPADRLLRILERFGVGESAPLETARGLCQVCVEALGVSGAGVMLMTDDVRRGSLCSSDPVSRLIEDLQYTFGEGPCVDAYAEDAPVLEPDLADPAAARWVAFTPPVVAAGARAVFGFPMRVGAVRLGALNLYLDRPGGLTDDQHADALVMAGVAARAVLVMQAKAPPGTLAAELEAGADFHFVVHQAAGMVAVQAAVTLAEALIRLRGHAFAEGRPLTAVAEDVVARRITFR